MVRSGRRRERRSARINPPDTSEEENNFDVDRDVEFNIPAAREEEFRNVRRYLENLTCNQYKRLTRGLHHEEMPVTAKRRPKNLQIPYFDARTPGDADYVSVEAFVKTVERETRIGNYEDGERIMIARDYIRGYARVRFDNAGLVEETDWQEFVRKIKEEFTESPAEVSRTLHALTILRQPGEKLQHFIERVSAVLNNYCFTGEMPDNEKLPHLQRILAGALPPEMGYPLLHPRNCKSLVEAVVGYAETHPQHKLTSADIAREKEVRSPPTVAAATVRPTKCNHQCSGNHATPETMNQQYENPVNYQPTRGRGRGSVRAPHCNGCGGSHLRSECTRSHHATCFNCGILGHLAIVCRKNAGTATEPSPVASTNFATTPPQQRPWAHQHQQQHQNRFARATYRPWAPSTRFTAPQPQFRAPQSRPQAPPQSQAAPNPAVAATSLPWNNQGFPWQRCPQPQTPLPLEQQQQQQQQNHHQQQQQQ